jgi:hypothetical protein
VSNRRVEVSEKETKALSLRAQGKSLAEIAEAVGYESESGASRAISRAMAKRQAVGVDAFRSYGWGLLEDIDRQAAAVVDSPGASDSDRLRALDLRRRVLQDRGNLIGYAKALERAAAQQDAETADMPDAGPGFLNVVSLDGVPTEVLPKEFEAVGMIPADTVVILLDPDWQLPPAGIGVFSRDGKLKRGNMLLRCEPEELEPFLEWRRAQQEERHARARETRGSTGAVWAHEDDGLIVDP